MLRIFTIGLFICGLISLFAREANTDDEVLASNDKVRIEECSKTTFPRHFEEIRKELKSRSCVLPRRTLPSSHILVKIRTLKSLHTFFQNRLHGENHFYKIIQINTDC